MPIFEYKCNKCCEDFEKLVFGNQKVICPNCSSGDITKKLSVFGMSGVENPGSSGCSKSSCGKSSCSSCR